MLDRREELLKTLRATPVVLRALVDGVDEARLRRRPAPGEWAIIEVVAHLADTWGAIQLAAHDWVRQAKVPPA
jgi:DTW domain-containing protein YfiP